MKLHRLRFADRRYRTDPWNVFAELREQGEVIRIKIPFLGKSWAGTTYDAVNDILKNTDDFVRDPRNAGRKSIVPMQWLLPRSFFSVVNNMLGADGEKHRRLRLLVDRAFALRNVAAMSDQIKRIAEDQLSSFAKIMHTHGRADLVEHYAQPLPLTVICELLGLPLEDRPKFKKWFAPFSSMQSVFAIFKLGAGVKKISAYLRREFKKLREQPGRPGLMSALVQTELEGDKLNESELLSMVFLLLVAGHETTVHLISNMLLTLLQHPKTKRELMDDWSLVDPAMDEVLRYCSPIQLSKPRYAAKDLVFRGIPIKKGEMVTALLASANYDPQRFDTPNVFNIHREKNYHMTFGSGPHVCLGMKLAKTETHYAIRTLFDAYPNLTTDFDIQAPDWSSRIGVRGMKTFFVREST